MIKKLTDVQLAEAVRRLAAEKEAEEGALRQRGEEDGYAAATAMAYPALRYAAETFLAAPDAKPYTFGMIFEDAVMGDFFRERMDVARLVDPELFEVLQDTDSEGWAQPKLEGYIDGWLFGVRVFWADVEGRI